MRGTNWDIERQECLTARDRDFFRLLLHHPRGPLFNYATGDHLTESSLARVLEFQRRLLSTPVGQWDWLDSFTRRCIQKVPHYQSYGHRPFAHVPTLRREILRDAYWTLVPQDVDLKQLVIYATSGTTGTALNIPGEATAEACYVPLLRKVLASLGLRLDGGPERVSIIQVAAQQRTLTYPAVLSVLGGAGFVKVNLNPDPAFWRQPEDMVTFLEECQTEIFTGTPLSYMALAQLPARLSPKALFCTSMGLLPGLRRSLETRFGCPVVDLYSMSECRAVAARVGEGRGYELVSPDLYVEIFDPVVDRVLEPGERGEIVLTGGRNPFFPLLRYRTGDFASLENGQLVGLEGRQPVRYRNSAGRWFDNIDITHCLSHLPLGQYHLHQNGQGNLRFRYRGGASDQQVRMALRGLLGAGGRLRVENWNGRAFETAKWISFTSDLMDPGQL